MKKKYCIGIRLESKSQESRVPLVPYDINDLINYEHKERIEIVIEKTRVKLEIVDGKYLRPRCFSDKEYEKSGAIISNDLHNCKVILGIKEIPLNQFQTGKTYVFFSHTYKGQDYNKSMFIEMIRKKCTLVDYELIVKNESEYKFEQVRKELNNGLAPASKFMRTVSFGKHAGIVGAINTLWILGMKLEADGFFTPFTRLAQAINYRQCDTNSSKVELDDHKEGINDYSLAVRALVVIREELINESTKKYDPVIIGITGKSSNPHRELGNVGKGVKEVIDILEPIELLPEDLINKEQFDNNEIYVVYFDRKQTTEVEFAKYLPKLTVILNCMKWEKGDDRPMSVNNLKTLYEKNPDKILVIGDITCDPGGSLEPCQDVYSDKPYYIYLPEKDTGNIGDWAIEKKRSGLFSRTCKLGHLKGSGAIITSITNLPCELPKEASRKFSFMLRDWIMELAKIDGEERDFTILKIRRPIKRAIILYKGNLTPDYKYLEEKYNLKK
ncbi:MAG: hypothetical protein DWQ06_16545 [Calditrichaeota bacterium]|nr:MAG: hypothetical protein DWQ06_16545 [Calditrichota bacterium]